MKKIILLLLVISSFLFKCSLKAQYIPKADSLALVDLYNSTDGAHWDKNDYWLTKAPITTWYGVFGDRLDLSQNALVGTIPSSIGELDYFKEINLGLNGLTGGIPASIGNLTSLNRLSLYLNRLTGEIPASISNLKKVQFLDLSGNKLSGGVGSISGMTALNTLKLGGNSLSGDLGALSGLQELTYVDLSYNHFDGNISPSAISNPYLGWFNISFNQFSFDGLEPLAILANSLNPPAVQDGTFIYSPQNDKPLNYKYGKLSFSAGGTLSKNTYTWYELSTSLGWVIATIIGDSTYTPKINGEHWVEVTNSLASHGMIQSVHIIIDVPANITDSLALVDLYKSTNGPGWNLQTNWLTTAPLHTWYGVSIDTNNRVYKLGLASNKLMGSLPSSIGNLAYLQELLLQNNALTGQLPVAFNSLTKLTNLNIANNSFTSPIPQKIGGFADLTQLQVQNNKFIFDKGLENMAARNFAQYGPQDSIPFNVSADKVTFSVPAYLSMPYGYDNSDVVTSHLKFAWYKNGQLLDNTSDSVYSLKQYVSAETATYWCIVTDSQIPNLTLYSKHYTQKPVISIVPSKDSLFLTNLYKSTNGANWKNHTNWLVPGTNISTWYGVTTNPVSGRVISIDLGSNNLTGTIPDADSLGNITYLSSINLGSNSITGSIPATLGNLQFLQTLNISFNAFSGNLPAALGKLTNLTGLSVWVNQLNGNIPPELGNLTSLTSLYLAWNQFTGSIPPELGNLTKLTELHLDQNQLSGTIPSSLLQLSKLTTLTLNNNSFTFNGLETIVQKFPFTNYSPQAGITLAHTNNILSVAAGGTLANNTYNLYRGNTQVKTQVGNAAFTVTYPGNYYITATNKVASQLTLTSGSFTVGGTSVIMKARPNTLTASYELTDVTGWTYYYNDANTPGNMADDTLLLTLNKNGQDIGSVGDGHFSLAVTATAGAGSNTGVKITNPLITNSSGYWVMNRFWKVTPTHEPTSTVMVRFYFNPQDVADVNGSYPAHNLTTSNLIFYKAIGGNPDPTSNLAGATKIISIMPGTTASETTWTYHSLGVNAPYGEFGVSGFSGGGGGGTGNNLALPLTLLNFNGILQKEAVLLNWQTTNEINSNYFEVQRSTGGDFTAIGTIAAANTSATNSYQLKDDGVALLNAQNVFYRLKMVDKNGAAAYSNIVVVKVSAGKNIVISPNPVQDVLYVRFTAIQPGKINARVSDVNGKVLIVKQFAVVAGNNQLVMPVSALTKGYYLLQIIDGSNSKTIPFVIVK